MSSHAIVTPSPLSHARSATVSIVSLLMVAIYPVSGFMRMCTFQLRLTHPNRNRTRIGLCARTYSNFTRNLCLFIFNQFRINHPQHLHTRETVRAIRASSSHMSHETKWLTASLILTDTPTHFSCLSIIASRFVIRMVPAVQSKLGRPPAASVAQKPQRTSYAWKARSSRN